MTVNLKELQALKPEATVIDPMKHARILADLDNVLARAGITKAALFSSAAGTCSNEELYWLTEYRKNAAIPRGFVFVGQPPAGGAGPERKMMSIAAALVRNYVDARVASLNSVLDGLENGDMPECTVLLIPNLFVKQGGKTIPSWQMQKVHDLLLARLVASVVTCCYVESLDALAAEYGASLSTHLRDHYMVLPA